MMDLNTSLATSILPQYLASEALMERFLVAAHGEGTLIERSSKSKNEKFALVDTTELDADVLNYFTHNKDTFRAEFTIEMKKRIKDEDLRVFCEVIADEWFDGKRLRQDGRPRRLKRSICDYLNIVTNNATPTSELVQINDFPSDVEPLITAESVAAILTVNNQMIHSYFQELMNNHPNSNHISSNDIFLRRGLALADELDTNIPYREWDFLNSYSIAFSFSEKFSQMVAGRTPAIVNGELSLFENRVLFFSPFIPGMDVGQLEFGIIPSERPLPLCAQGSHGGIQEYIIDPAPFQR